MFSVQKLELELITSLQVIGRVASVKASACQVVDASIDSQSVQAVVSHDKTDRRLSLSSTLLPFL